MWVASAGGLCSPGVGRGRLRAGLHGRARLDRAQATLRRQTWGRIGNDDARGVAGGIAQRPRTAPADGPRRSIATMLPAANLDGPSVPVAGIHSSLTGSTIATGGRLPTARAGRRGDRALDEAPDRTVPGVRDPAIEAQVHRRAEHEIAEADALDRSADDGIEPRGCASRSNDRRSGCRAARRPGEDERIEHELGREFPARSSPIQRRGPGTPAIRAA